MYIYYILDISNLNVYHEILKLIFYGPKTGKLDYSNCKGPETYRTQQ